MQAEFAELVEELKALRKGRGVMADQIDARVGPALRSACDISADDTPADLRRKLTEFLSGLAQSLPDDLRMAVIAAFGLESNVRLRLYQDRIKWAADHLQRDDRTIRRRMDEGINQLAELAVGAGAKRADRMPADDVAWHTRLLRVSVALDQAVPEVFEFREVVADQDNVAELDLAITLRDGLNNRFTRPTELQMDVFYGGTLMRRTLQNSGRIGLTLGLPVPLSQGESHEYAVRLRTPLQPFYACVPRNRCEEFDLRVRFPPDRVPEQIWVLRRAFQEDVSDPTPGPELIRPDRLGEVHLSFRGLEPGFGYGIGWEPMEPDDVLDPADAPEPADPTPGQRSTEAVPGPESAADARPDRGADSGSGADPVAAADGPDHRAD